MSQVDKKKKKKKKKKSPSSNSKHECDHTWAKCISPLNKLRYAAKTLR